MGTVLNRSSQLRAHEVLSAYDADAPASSWGAWLRLDPRVPSDWWELSAGAGGPLAFLCSEQVNPFDFTEDLRIFPATRLEQSSFDGECLLTALASLAREKGLRKVYIHLLMVESERKWTVELMNVLRSEGCLRHFFAIDAIGLDDLVLSFSAEDVPISSWALEDPLFSDADEVAVPPWLDWEAVGSSGSEGSSEHALMPSCLVDPSEVGRLEVDAFISSRREGFGAHSLEPKPSPVLTDWDFCMVRRSDGAIVARVSAVGLNTRALHCGVRIVVHPRESERGLAHDAGLLFLDEIFVSLPLRKVYFDLSTPATSRFSNALGRSMSLEAHLVHDYLYRGVPVDRFIWSISRRQWVDLREPFRAGSD